LRFLRGSHPDKSFVLAQHHGRHHRFLIVKAEAVVPAFLGFAFSVGLGASLLQK
jgi:hypothetical protein